jgi:hypothetical protein
MNRVELWIDFRARMITRAFPPDQINGRAGSGREREKSGPAVGCGTGRQLIYGRNSHRIRPRTAHSRQHAGDARREAHRPLRDFRTQCGDAVRLTGREPESSNPWFSNAIVTVRIEAASCQLNCPSVSGSPLEKTELPSIQTATWRSVSTAPDIRQDRIGRCS